jgi:hypothetical protein
MLEKLFGNPVIEKILFYLLMNEKSYGAELARTLETPLYSVQMALQRLEDGAIIAAVLEGKTRVYQFNPRYPFLVELKAFLTKAYSFLPDGHKTQYYEAPIRRRPRRKGKPYRLVDD